MALFFKQLQLLYKHHYGQINILGYSYSTHPLKSPGNNFWQKSTITRSSSLCYCRTLRRSQLEQTLMMMMMMIMIAQSFTTTDIMTTAIMMMVRLMTRKPWTTTPLIMPPVMTIIPTVMMVMIVMVADMMTMTMTMIPRHTVLATKMITTITPKM